MVSFMYYVYLIKLVYIVLCLLLLFKHCESHPCCFMSYSFILFHLCIVGIPLGKFLLLLNIVVVSSLGLLQMILPRTFVYVSFVPICMKFLGDVGSGIPGSEGICILTLVGVF